MTDPLHTEPVEVTEADREAAVGILRLSLSNSAERAMMIEAGELDSDPLVQAFARHRTAAEAESRAREARLREALTPSGSTKAAYHGEFSFQLFRGVSDAGIDQYEKVYVPWDTVKEIMAAIAARAALTASEGGDHG